MRDRRRRQRADAPPDVDELRGFLARQIHVRRRAEVRRLMDGGYDYTAIVEAFADDPALTPYLENVSAKLVLLRRDVDHWKLKDRGKALIVVQLEGIARTLARALADPAVSPSARIKVAQDYEKACTQIAKLTGAIVGVPGVGPVLRPDEEDDEEYEIDPAYDVGTPEYDARIMRIARGEQ
jgi:hypothetical protein